MKRLLLLALSCFFILTSCKKDSKVLIPPGNPNNEIKAMVSVGSETPALHQSNGNSTIFSRRIGPIRGDTIITVSGSIGEFGTRSSRKLELWLINISGPGTYALDPGSRQKLWCVYMIGVSALSASEMYFSDRANPPGTVTIDVLSDSEIRGSFTANCSNSQHLSNGINYIQITNGTFKGTFAK